MDLRPGVAVVLIAAGLAGCVSRANRVQALRSAGSRLARSHEQSLAEGR